VSSARLGEAGAALWLRASSAESARIFHSDIQLPPRPPSCELPDSDACFCSHPTCAILRGADPVCTLTTTKSSRRSRGYRLLYCNGRTILSRAFFLSCRRFRLSLKSNRPLIVRKRGCDPPSTGTLSAAWPHEPSRRADMRAASAENRGNPNSAAGSAQCWPARACGSWSECGLRSTQKRKAGPRRLQPSRVSGRDKAPPSATSVSKTYAQITL
jgi:hypothetical protein